MVSIFEYSGLDGGAILAPEDDGYEEKHVVLRTGLVLYAVGVFTLAAAD